MSILLAIGYYIVTLNIQRNNKQFISNNYNFKWINNYLIYEYNLSKSIKKMN